MTTVKITELTNIGANLATSTLVPVVNMAGTPTTQKTTVGNIANLILEGAGVDYPEATVALLAQTVSNASQPNITSTGTLTGLTVSGNTNLGAVANVRITGGTAGQVLSTDGTGNLSWASDATTYGNSNVANYLPTYTGNVGANWVIADYFSGNAHNLTYLPGANVNGAVAYATTANSVAAANVSGLGNIALSNYDGNASNVLHGDGSWSADTTTYSNANVASYLPTYTGNVGVNTLLFADNSFQATAFVGTATTAEGLSNVGNATVVVDPLGANVVWSFDTTGNLNLPTNGDLNFNAGGIVQTPMEDFNILVQDSDNDGWQITQTIDAGDANIWARTRLQRDQYSVNIQGKQWSFNNNGILNLAGDVQGEYGVDSNIYVINNGANGSLNLKTISYVGDTLISNIQIANPNVTISTSNAAHTWTFDNTGILTLPGGAIVDPTSDNFEVRGIQNVNFEANATVNIYTDTSNNGWQWQFGDDGNTGFPGHLNYVGLASPAPSINGFSSASFALGVTADQVLLSDNAISTVGGSSNLILNTQYGSATDSFIQVPTFQDGGEELIIKNGYGSSLGVRVQTGSGNFRFNGNDLTFTDSTTQNTAWTGSVALANVSGAGNIASVNLDGNVSNVLYGNGSFAAAPSSSYGDSNVATLLSNFGSNTIATTGNISVGEMTASGKIGYASGSTITQTTNRGQGVNITALAGTIVTVSDTIAAGDADYFFVTNPLVDPTTDIVLVQVTSYNPGTYVVIAQPTSTPSNGFLLSITNITGFASPTEAITIRFMVLKSPNA